MAGPSGSSGTIPLPPRNPNSPPTSPLSDHSSLSQLSELSKSPSPPPRPPTASQTSHLAPGDRYPTPQSTIPSGSSSPMSKRPYASDYNESRRVSPNDPDPPPPVKKRKVGTPRPRAPKQPKERTTLNLDLSRAVADDANAEQDNLLERLTHALRYKKKVVVIAGAGISVSAGIPDFRSSKGLFATQGKELFDASVYRHDDSTRDFHDMMRKLVDLSSKATPTPFHHVLASMATEGRLLRLYTQNVDGLETSMEPLATRIPLNQKGPWPTTIQLHGSLERMVCSKCNELRALDVSLFTTGETPECPSCKEIDSVRTAIAGKRSHGVGRLRPRMVLYNEHNPDQDAIGSVSSADIRCRPDAVIVVGTTLKIPGVRRLVKEMCQVTRGRKDGFTAWINLDPQGPQGVEFKDCFDIVVNGAADDVATLLDLPRWDDVESTDDLADLTDSRRQSIERKLSHSRLEVQLPMLGSDKPDRKETDTASKKQLKKARTPSLKRGRPKPEATSEPNTKQPKIDFTHSNPAPKKAAEAELTVAAPTPATVSTASGPSTKAKVTKPRARKPRQPKKKDVQVRKANISKSFKTSKVPVTGSKDTKDAKDIKDVKETKEIMEGKESKEAKKDADIRKVSNDKDTKKGATIRTVLPTRPTSRIPTTTKTPPLPSRIPTKTVTTTPSIPKVSWGIQWLPPLRPTKQVQPSKPYGKMSVTADIVHLPSQDMLYTPSQADSSNLSFHTAFASPPLNYSSGVEQATISPTTIPNGMERIID